ncbi:NADP-dependent phosphogluconate dehydrogenase, partial [Rhodococcus hoagii]|nr:NADP-dependent phosphogluconate dehydrogenase [Prescottella equi]
RRALYASKIVAYAQGFDQIRAGSDEYGWDLTPATWPRSGAVGCIIRARFLNRIKEAYDTNPELTSLIVEPYFREAIENAIDSWRRVVVTATTLGIPVPAFASSLSYYDGLRAERPAGRTDPGPARLLRRPQYGRVDMPGKFHTLWSGDRSEIEA